MTDNIRSEDIRGRKRAILKSFAKILSAMTAVSVLTACGSSVPAAAPTEETAISEAAPAPSQGNGSVRSAVNFDHELDGYVPQKDHNNFYFTYKTVHSWWEASVPPAMRTGQEAPKIPLQNTATWRSWRRSMIWIP